ncbi:hypothetical protein EV182_002806 [Spiromyces aspiralis]|uniref:Uncharacterized protein n=1 Tax=Spiromyces aspiralis TaxID=68401 RepID=A0ACC1HYX2_9FUNG|nr:hypothetical protein EV182_002806 [Spiromyces aspiralis]
MRATATAFAAAALVAIVCDVASASPIYQDYDNHNKAHYADEKIEYQKHDDKKVWDVYKESKYPVYKGYDGDNYGHGDDHDDGFGHGGDYGHGDDHDDGFGHGGDYGHGDGHDKGRGVYDSNHGNDDDRKYGVDSDYGYYGYSDHKYRRGFYDNGLGHGDHGHNYDHNHDYDNDDGHDVHYAYKQSNFYHEHQISDEKLEAKKHYPVYPNINDHDNDHNHY